MSSKLSVNVNDPNASNTPDEPADAEPIVIPDTGGNTILDTKNISDNGVSMVLPIVGGAVLVAIIVVTIITATVRRRKVNKFSVHTSRHLVAKVASLSIVLLLGLFAIANLNGDSGSVSALLFGGDSNTKASIHDSVNALSITTNDIVIDLDLEDDKVFGVGESVVSVDTATTAGYTLMAYVDSNSTDLKNETNTSSSSTISMLETTYSQALIDNTWGMAISKPNSEEDVLFRGLPTTEKEIMTLKATSESTPAGDESTFYYGAYITPDLDYGTYGGVTINYVALANVDTDAVTVRYHIGGGSSARTNTVVYNFKPRVAYYYDGCSTEYLGESQILKSYNIDDDGTMLELMMTSNDEPNYIEFVDADYLRVELTYGFRYTSRVEIYKGSDDWTHLFGEFGSNQNWDVNRETTTIVFNYDSNVIGLSTTSDDSDGYTGASYGYYARITPVYVKKPSDVSTIDYENCFIAKSSNIDDDGNKVSTYDLDSDSIYDSIIAPGAGRLVVDVNYGVSADGNRRLMLGKGTWYHWSRPFEYYYLDEDMPLLESGRFYIGGDSATIGINLYRSDVNYAETYGYYVRGYPIYNEEREGSVPVLVYDFSTKNGVYDPADYNDWNTWGVVSHDESDSFSGELNVIKYLESNFEFLRGQTVDLNATYYMS